MSWCNQKWHCSYLGAEQLKCFTEAKKKKKKKKVFFFPFFKIKRKDLWYRKQEWSSSSRHSGCNYLKQKMLLKLGFKIYLHLHNGAVKRLLKWKKTHWSMLLKRDSTTKWNMSLLIFMNLKSNRNDCGSYVLLACIIHTHSYPKK